MAAKSRYQKSKKGLPGVPSTGMAEAELAAAPGTVVATGKPRKKTAKQMVSEMKKRLAAGRRR